MSVIQWNKSFEIGIEEFDDNHKHLVNLLNKTSVNYCSGANHEELASVLYELADYATYHFAAEERWMAEHEYPGLLLHCKEHETFSDKITEFKHAFQNGKSDLAQTVLSFLTTWLSEHILKTDAEYGRFAQGLPHDPSG